MKIFRPGLVAQKQALLAQYDREIGAMNAEIESKVHRIWAWCNPARAVTITGGPSGTCSRTRWVDENTTLLHRLGSREWLLKLLAALTNPAGQITDPRRAVTIDPRYVEQVPSQSIEDWVALNAELLDRQGTDKSKWLIVYLRGLAGELGNAVAVDEPEISEEDAARLATIREAEQHLVGAALRGVTDAEIEQRMRVPEFFAGVVAGVSGPLFDPRTALGPLPVHLTRPTTNHATAKEWVKLNAAFLTAATSTEEQSRSATIWLRFFLMLLTGRIDVFNDAIASLDPNDTESLRLAKEAEDIVDPWSRLSFHPSLAEGDVIVDADTWIAANVKAILSIGAEKWLFGMMIGLREGFGLG